jgi:hypothetical protein
LRQRWHTTTISPILVDDYDQFGAMHFVCSLVVIFGISCNCETWSSMWSGHVRHGIDIAAMETDASHEQHGAFQNMEIPQTASLVGVSYRICSRLENDKCKRMSLPQVPSILRGHMAPYLEGSPPRLHCLSIPSKNNPTN